MVVSKCGHASAASVPKGLRDFAAKRRYRTAQGFSPRSAVGKRCPESGTRC